MKWIIIAAVIIALILLILTQSDRLAANLYLRYLDNKWSSIELTGFSPSGDELQDGFPDDWIPRTWSNGRAVIQKETEEVHTGTYAAQIERTSSGGVAALTQLFLVPEGATGVILRVFAKGDGGAAQVRYLQEGQVSTTNLGWQDIPARQEWQQYQVTKPLPPDAYQIEVLLRSNGRTYFDDAFFQFLKAGEGMGNLLANPDFETDGQEQDPLVWWQEHTIMPNVDNIPETALAGELPFLNILDMLNGRYDNIRRRISEQESSCITKPEMTSWLLDLAPKVEEQGGPAAREKLYQLAIFLAPTCPQPYGQLARLYEENGAYQAAAQQYRLAAELSGETSLAGFYYFNEGLMHVRHTGSLEQAVFTLQKAEELEAWVTGIVFKGASTYSLGQAYKNAGQFEEAAVYFQKVLDCDDCRYYQDAAAAELANLNNQ